MIHMAGRILFKGVGGLVRGWGLVCVLALVMLREEEEEEEEEREREEGKFGLRGMVKGLVGGGLMKRLMLRGIGILELAWMGGGMFMLPWEFGVGEFKWRF